ncbi:cytochrome P450, partial [Mycobacterium sp. ITM-2017-0098]
QIAMSKAGMQAMSEIWLMYYELIKQRRDHPQDDMISELIAAEQRREPGDLGVVQPGRRAVFALHLGGAGAETVTKLVGSAVVTFGRHPDQWQQLLDDRSKVAVAIE